jgi:hypothetical protein
MGECKKEYFTYRDQIMRILVDKINCYLFIIYVFILL